MAIDDFSDKWFVIYYFLLGFLLIGTGLVLILKKQRGEDFLAGAAGREKPPQLFIIILKYFLLFTLPALVLSFIPFSWVNLLFSLWSLLFVYIAGIQLVRWEQTRTLIEAKKDELSEVVGRCGALMMSVGFVMFLLVYLMFVQY